MQPNRKPTNPKPPPLDLFGWGSFVFWLGLLLVGAAALVRFIVEATR